MWFGRSMMADSKRKVGVLWELGGLGWVLCPTYHFDTVIIADRAEPRTIHTRLACNNSGT